MDQRIVYQLPGSQVAVMIPCECGLSIEVIARKDVPAGVPFWIVDATTIPTDRTFRDAWQLDIASMGEPSGFGGEA